MGDADPPVGEGAQGFVVGVADGAASVIEGVRRALTPRFASGSASSGS